MPLSRPPPPPPDELTQVVIRDVHAVEEVILQLRLRRRVQRWEPPEPGAVLFVRPSASTTAFTVVFGLLEGAVDRLVVQLLVLALQSQVYSRIPSEQLLDPEWSAKGEFRCLALSPAFVGDGAGSVGRTTSVNGS